MAWSRIGLTKVSSRNWSSVMIPRSTSSNASAIGSVMSGTSQWEMSDPSTGRSRAPSGLMSSRNAHTKSGSSASQPK